MSLLNRLKHSTEEFHNMLKRQKKFLLGVVLGGILAMTGQEMKQNDSKKSDNTKMVKSEQIQNSLYDDTFQIQQKITYLDEYTSAVKSGMNKEDAYRKLALKMADGNSQKMAEMQKQLERMQREQKTDKGLLLLFLSIGAFLIYKNDFNFTFSFKVTPKQKKDVTPKQKKEASKAKIGFFHE